MSSWKSRTPHSKPRWTADFVKRSARLMANTLCLERLSESRKSSAASLSTLKPLHPKAQSRESSSALWVSAISSNFYAKGAAQAADENPKSTVSMPGAEKKFGKLCAESSPHGLMSR